MQEVIYNGDRRYPAPRAHPPPDGIEGIPTQAELDAYPRMFTWGELKGIIKSGELELLMRNKAMQARYDTWMTGMKLKYGSTEKYLTTARLPWSQSSEPGSGVKGTYDPNSLVTDIAEEGIKIADLTISTNNQSQESERTGSDDSNITDPGEAGQSSFPSDSTAATTDGSTVASAGRANVGPTRSIAESSGAATPSSAGFVSLASLKLVNGKLRKSRGGGKSTPPDGGSETGTSTPSKPLNGSVLGQEKGDGDRENDEEGEDNEEDNEDEDPVYLKWDPKGLDGEKYAVLPNDWPYNIPYGVRHYCVWSRVPIAHPELVNYDPTAWSRIEQEGLGGFSGITPVQPFSIPSPPSSDDPTGTRNPSHIASSKDIKGRSKFIGTLPDRDWYAADVAYAGEEMVKWAGEEYESEGGQEVGRMVRGLWDPRGWECLWFVNPPRLQSVPGFSHFHVFARRKTPEEIDASEAFWVGLT